VKALLLKGQGGWDRLAFGEVGEPWPEDDECLVNVHAVGLDAIDLKDIAGASDALREPSFPAVPGFAFAGVVVRTGARVTRFRAGDAVVGCLGGERRGALAERCLALECELAHKPRGLSFEEAAGVPLAALGAWQGVHEVLSLTSEDTLLVATGAQGGLSTWVVQIAKEAGANVVVAGPASRRELTESLGAKAFLQEGEAWPSSVPAPTAAFLAASGDVLAALVKGLPAGARVVNCDGPVPPHARLPGSGSKAEPVGMGQRGSAFRRLRLWSAGLGIRKLVRTRGVAYEFLSPRADGGQLEAITRGLDASRYVAKTERVYEFHDAIAALRAFSESPPEGAAVVRMPIAWRSPRESSMKRMFK
jgi:NADPH:quinone reductase-like Zn-dependent oxidoreductase